MRPQYFACPADSLGPSVAALGRLDLATVSNDHSKHREMIRPVPAAADVYVALSLRNSSNGYGARLELLSLGLDKQPPQRYPNRSHRLLI